MSGETTANAAPVAATDSVKPQESNQNLENQENLEADGEEGGEEKPLTPAEKKKLKQLDIKFNGKSEKIDLPFEIDEEHADFMRKQLQMAKMAQVKAQEAAGWEREVAGFLHELQANPRKALSDPRYGVDLRKVAAEILQEEYELSQKSPEEIAKEKEQEERRKFLEEKEAWEKKKKDEENNAKLDSIAKQYDNIMASSMDKFDIPKTPEAMSRMAHFMSLEIARGFEPDMDVIGQYVEDSYSNEYKTLLKNLSPEKRRKLLGEEIFEEDRKQRVAKMKKAPPTAKNVAQDAGKVDPKKDSGPKRTYKDFFKI
jgi:DNA phosphorothioation-dependent restriction protein DptG